MASNALCALCGLIVAAVANFYGVSAQKSKWNLLEFKLFWGLFLLLLL